MMDAFSLSQISINGLIQTGTWAKEWCIMWQVDKRQTCTYCSHVIMFHLNRKLTTHSIQFAKWCQEIIHPHNLVGELPWSHMLSFTSCTKNTHFGLTLDSVPTYCMPSCTMPDLNFRFKPQCKCIDECRRALSPTYLHLDYFMHFISSAQIPMLQDCPCEFAPSSLLLASSSQQTRTLRTDLKVWILCIFTFWTILDPINLRLGISALQL